jgi:hypothetical protein
MTFSKTCRDRAATATAVAARQRWRQRQRRHGHLWFRMLTSSQYSFLRHFCLTKHFLLKLFGRTPNVGEYSLKVSITFLYIHVLSRNDSVHQYFHEFG